MFHNQQILSFLWGSLLTFSKITFLEESGVPSHSSWTCFLRVLALL